MTAKQAEAFEGLLKVLPDYNQAIGANHRMIGNKFCFIGVCMDKISPDSWDDRLGCDILSWDYDDPTDPELCRDEIIEREYGWKEGDCLFIRRMNDVWEISLVRIGEYVAMAIARGQSVRQTYFEEKEIEYAKDRG
jgi:hypothetical protein